MNVFLQTSWIHVLPDSNIDEVIQAKHPSNVWSNQYDGFEAYVDYEYVDEPRSEDSEEAGVGDEDGTVPTSRRHSIDENRTSSGPAQPTQGEGQLIDLEDDQPQLRQSVVRKTVILDVSRPTTIRLDLELALNPSLILQVDKTAVRRRIVSAGHPESNASAVQIQSFQSSTANSGVALHTSGLVGEPGSTGGTQSNQQAHEAETLPTDQPAADNQPHRSSSLANNGTPQPSIPHRDPTSSPLIKVSSVPSARPSIAGQAHGNDPSGAQGGSAPGERPAKTANPRKLANTHEDGKQKKKRRAPRKKQEDDIDQNMVPAEEESKAEKQARERRERAERRRQQ